VWHYQLSGTSDEGGDAIKDIFGESVFDNPKPVKLVRRMLQLATDSNGQHIVLDSCAGSGTTGHAVLEQNLEDEGDRRFILIQQPFDTKGDEQQSHNITKMITSERVRRIAVGYPRKSEGHAGERAAGLGGSFTYARVGDPLFGEYRDLGDRLPRFVELAKYIFYTETSRECDLRKVDEKSGFIGATEAAGGTSYYLLYTPNRKEDRELSTETLKALLKADRNRSWVIYCEKIWLHPEQLRAFEKENDKSIRPMLVPFNLK
jgi:adenine-specific DNA-methyltransferase